MLNIDRLGETLSDDALKMFLREISRYKLLTAAQEVEYAKRLEAGDESAREILIVHNLRLVVRIAKQYPRANVPLGEVISEGIIGLMRAVEKFDYHKGFRFSTYATWWIRQAVTRFVNENDGLIRRPEYVVGRITKMRRVARQYEQDHTGVSPSDHELATLLNWQDADGNVDVTQLAEVRAADVTMISLDAPTDEEGEGTLADTIEDLSTSPEDAAASQATVEAIRQVLGELSAQERRVLQFRFGILDGRQRTLDETAQQFGLTRERIRQIEVVATNKLKTPQRRDQVREFIN